MTGKVTIIYMFEENQPQAKQCSAFLHWGDETLAGYGYTWEEAKENAIRMFKAIPPSEELVIE